MHRMLVVLALGSVIGCAAKPAARTGEPVSPGLAIERIPERAGDFERTEIRRMQVPGAGTLYRFRSPRTSLAPDVYIYPLTATARQGGETARLQAAAEAQLFKAALALQQRRGRFDNYEVHADSSITLPMQQLQIEGWHTMVHLRRGGQVLESHQHLVVLGDQIVKVRATFPRGSTVAVELEPFLRALAQELTRGTGDTTASVVLSRSLVQQSVLTPALQVMKTFRSRLTSHENG